MKQLYTLGLALATMATLPVSAQDEYVFTATDISGTTHDIAAYLDDDKPVLIYDFSAIDGSLWLGHEEGVAVDLYNTLGQGGSEEIVVLYVAGYDFNDLADIQSIDYSASLGAGYDDLDLTENNPIPIILAADNPEVQPFAKGQRLWVCPQNEIAWLNPNGLDTDAILFHLFNSCCTTVEDDDLSLSWTEETIFQPACDPSTFSYNLSNESGADQVNIPIQVLLNGSPLESFVYEEPLEGCNTVQLEYSNDAIAGGDMVTILLNQSDAFAFNDSISIERDVVDTTGTTVKLEILNPSETWGAMNFQCYPNEGGGLVNSGTNWENYLFLSPGCYRLSIGAYEDVEESDSILIGSVDANDQYTDTLFYGTLPGFSPSATFTIHVEGEPAEQKVWGYVFEDVNAFGSFSSEMPRVDGVQVNYGNLTTFSDVDGYYEFPEVIPGENVSVTYDESVWPVITTPNAGNVSSNGFIHNFGLNSDDPLWELSSNFDTGLPYQCESGINNTITVWNTGNQPAAGELVFTYDPLLTPVDFNPAPSTVNGNEITFAIPQIQLGGAENFTVSYEDVSADLLGEELTAAYSITTLDDQGNVVNTDNNSITDTIYCAYDPNDKFGFPVGDGPEGLIEEGTPLRYRIRFQNTGNLPAATVIVRDTLPEELNWESFEPFTASHAHTIMMDSETREVVWTFNNIMLPDSASDPEGSIGWIWFDMEMNDLDLGDQIENTAYIFFDQNVPIITNTSLHTISQELAVDGRENVPFTLFPNPSGDRIFIRGDFSEVKTVQITDLSGRLVLQKSLNRNAIDISSLSDGLYLVTVGKGKAIKLMVAKP